MNGVPSARLGALVPPLALGVLAVLLWQGAVTVLGIEPFVLPAPFDIAGAFAENAGNVAAAASVTGRNSLAGLAGGAVIGVVAAVLAAALGSVERLGSPLVAALSVVPVVALAPVLYTMYGADAQAARQIVAGVAAFVPVYVNSLKGFRRVQPVHRDLMRACAATTWQATRAVTLPGALPHISTGLKQASSLAVISALVAEYFGGPVGGLGKSITSAAASSNYTLAWAYVLGAVTVGLVFYLATVLLERLSTRH